MVEIPLIDMKFHWLTFHNFIIVVLLITLLLAGCFILYLKVKMGLKDEVVQTATRGASRYLNRN